MTKDDAVMLTEALEKLNVICKPVEELNLWAIVVYTGEDYPMKWCSVIGSNGVVTWGQIWEFSVQVNHPEMAAPAIVRTLPKEAFKKPVIT
jgi:hypothetical protein